MDLKDLLDATPIPPLQWAPWWFQDDGYREYARAPEDHDNYHVSDEGWWRSLGYLNKCEGIEAAKAAVEVERRKRLYAMFGYEV